MYLDNFGACNSASYCDKHTGDCTCSASEDTCALPEYCLGDSCTGTHTLHAVVCSVDFET